MLVTHTSLVETATLAYLLLLRAYIVQPGIWRAVAVGLGFGLALHAHPTTIALLPLSLICAWRFGPRAVWRLQNVTAAAAGGVALFLPYLVVKAMTGWPDAGSTAVYVGQSVALSQLVALPQLASAVYWSGPHTLTDALLPSGTRAVAFGSWAAVLGASAIAAAIGWRRMNRADRVLVGYAVVRYFVTLCTLCVLRDRVPWYMAYLPALAGAALLAAVWRSLMSAWPRTLPIVGLAEAGGAAPRGAPGVGPGRPSPRAEFR